MPVFDPRQGQVLVSPVTSFYQGKAIRQQQKDAEQMGRMRELQIEEAEYQASPERRAKAEEILDLKLQQARSAVDQAVVDLGAETLKFMANTLAPITSGATSMAMSGDLEGATEYYNREIKRLLPTLPGPIAEAVQKGAGPDKVYSPEEIANTKLMLSQWGAKNDEKRTQAKFVLNGKPVQGSFDKYGNYYDANGQLATGKVEPFATGRTEEDLIAGGGDPRTESQRGSDYSDNLRNYNQSSDIEEMVSTALPRVASLPGAVGFTGKAGIAGAGLLTTLGQDELANRFAEWTSDATPEEISSVMAQLQAVRGQLLPIVTGQESRARLSDEERRVGDRAVALIEEIKGPADLAKSYPQVIGALKQFYEETWAKKYRIAQQDPNINYPYDLSKRAQAEELIAEFQEAGIDDESIGRALLRLGNIQGVEFE